MIGEAQLREQLCRFSRRVWERGWVANHDGNLSVRLPRSRLMCTPTGLSKGDLDAGMMLVVDEGGKVLSGRLRPFSELNLHLAYYHARPDVHAVIHSHAPTATGFGVAGIGLEDPMLPEQVVSLGPSVPLVPAAMPGADAARAIAPYLDDFDALLLSGNGVLTCGDDLEQAYLRMELVEHLCRITLVARQLGGAQQVPTEVLPTLLTARTRAGLGPQARGRSGPPAQRPTPASEPEPSQHDLERLVQAEISRVLKSR